SFAGNGQDSVLVTGKAVWWVPGDFSLVGQSQIVLVPGATLMLFVGRSSGSTGVKMDLGGNGVFNGTGYATNFMAQGLPTCTTASLSGNAGFIGAIYAPNADFTANGGGNNVVIDFNGSGVFRTVKMNGNYNFHYDEALGRFGPRLGYYITGWNEL